MTAVETAPEPAFADPQSVALCPGADVVLQVRGLSVAFGGIQAVDDVNFDLVRGEILGVVGPNGAGKTTMFDAISGFVSSTGKVSLDGTDVGPMQPEARSRRRLGRSFQDARLFPSLTVFETLNLALERHQRAQDPISTALTLPWVRRAERDSATKATELIDRMGLTAFRDKFVSELSTGSRRIVDLACIMAHDPLVLLLDEPSSGIAQREAEALGPLLLRLREDTGVSIVIIEHDMPMLTAVSDRLLALETGSVLTAGHKDNVLNDSRLIAAYLGSNEAIVHRSGSGAAPSRNETEETLDESPTERQPDATPASRGRTQAVKRPATKRASTRKATMAKKATSKKKATKKKAAPKKSAAKKTTTKKRATTKKAAPKRTAKKAASKKRATTKKRAPKRAATKKRGATKKTASKKKSATKKRSAGKKAAPRKTAAKKRAATKRPAKKRA